VGQFHVVDFHVSPLSGFLFLSRTIFLPTASPSLRSGRARWATLWRPSGTPDKTELSTLRIFCVLGIFGGGERRNLRFEMSEDWRLHVELVELFGDAEVHDNEESGAAGAFGGRFVCDAFLHPYCAGADVNCAIDDFGHKF